MNPGCAEQLCEHVCAGEAGAMRPATRKPDVTAGLKWALDSPPNTLTVIDSATPRASALPSRPDTPATAGVLQTMAPMPAKHR